MLLGLRHMKAFRSTFKSFRGFVRGISSDKGFSATTAGSSSTSAGNLPNALAAKSDLLPQTRTKPTFEVCPWLVFRACLQAPNRYAAWYSAEWRPYSPLLGHTSSQQIRKELRWYLLYIHRTYGIGAFQLAPLASAAL